jgi:nitrite reductase (NADH) small subunit
MNMASANWIDIGALEDIPREGARVVRTAAGCVAVFRTADDRAFALDDRCPHKGGPLSEGIVHGTSVASHQVRIEGGRILIDAGQLIRRAAA